jgi:putative DNA primase/helicase
MKTAAHLHAQKGRPVFPVYGVRDGRCTCTKDSCSSPGKHPATAQGFRDATTDPEQIERWWSEHPDRNIGVPTGRGSGWLVVDIDPDKGGEETLAALEREYGALPTTAQVLTGRDGRGGRGRHLYFKHPPTPIKSGAEVLGPGIDIRADGGYIIIPPSLHVTGVTYDYA